MTVTVYIPTPYRRLTSGAAHLPIDLTDAGATLGALVDRLETLHPGLKAELWEGDDFKHYVNVYVNGEEVRALLGSATTLSTGDEVAFIPMLAGGAPESLTVAKAYIEEMVAHAEAEFPNECCGLLSGRALKTENVHRMTNVEASPFVYLMDPREQLRVFDAIDQSGDELLAIYHSHTRSPAYPSPTDVRQAYYPESIYVIVSLQDRQSPVTRAFRIVDGEVREVEVLVR